MHFRTGGASHIASMLATISRPRLPSGRTSVGVSDVCRTEAGWKGSLIGKV